VNEWVKGDLAVSISTDTETQQVLEILYRNKTHNFKVDASTPELICQPDVKSHWRPTMIHGLFPFMAEQASYVNSSSSSSADFLVAFIECVVSPLARSTGFERVLRFGVDFGKLLLLATSVLCRVRLHRLGQ
jgi:hypothetical protein